MRLWVITYLTPTTKAKIIIFVVALIIIIVVVVIIIIIIFIIEIVGIRSPARKILVSYFAMFSCSSNHCPSAGCASAAFAVHKSTDIFRKLMFECK
jgi:hypothetical protein